MKLFRVLLADDHRLLLDAFTQLFEGYDEYDIVGTALDGRQLIAQALRLKPDIVIADVAMPLLNGLDALERLKQRLPHTAFIILTASEDPDLARRALEAGAMGYLLKSEASTRLFEALRAVRQGRRYMCPAMASVLEDIPRTGRSPLSGRRPLTPRQREVLQLLAEGRSMKEVAATLGMTPRTVAFHKYRVMDQFRLKSTADLVQFAIRERLISAL
ncbi:DNA-binding response regulator [Nitrospira tepida]|uniref:DNA-binding response regulator n=1 Tax=Nitrospira tepida TaxID=2973512 RepID=A0AA86N051_9BACT|nr:response regulator transcription factor [Nitrospira tepida]CAI4032106.1 DNA-binding response regulator [Nitrospira tepida]